jgi:hypothetical protein
LAFRIGYTPTRVVCMNTLSVAVNSGEATHVRIPHLSGANKAIEQVTKTIEAVDARFEKTAEIFRALAAVKVRGTDDLRRYVDAVFNPGKGEKEAGGDTLGELLGRSVTPLPSVFSADVGETTKETKSFIFEEIARLFEHGKGNDLAGVKGTAWAAYNAVTEHMTWNRGKNQDSRLENLWMSNAGATGRALPAAVDQFLAAA